jgi:hypothetical protein
MPSRTELSRRFDHTAWAPAARTILGGSLTARQGASGLGIEAQRQAIDGFVAQRKTTLIARFTKVESGRNPDRPELGKASCTSPR